MKQLVKDNLDDEVSTKLLTECNSEIPVGLKSPMQKKSDTQNGPITSPTGTLKNVLQDNDYDLYSTIRCAQRSFIITDPSLPDNPIMFASPGFLALSKYSLEEVIGRNCRFMQGPHTDTNEVEKLRKGISDGVDTSVVLLNYKKDGTAFYNQIFVAGLRNASGKIINYVGVQAEVKVAMRTGRNASTVTSSQQETLGAGVATSVSGTANRTSKRGRSQRASLTRDAAAAAAAATGAEMNDGSSEFGLMPGPAVVSINGARVDHLLGAPLPLSSSSPNQEAIGIPGGFSLYGGSSQDFRFTLIGEESRRSRSNSLTLPPHLSEILPQMASQIDVPAPGEEQSEVAMKGVGGIDKQEVGKLPAEVSPRSTDSPGK